MVSAYSDMNQPLDMLVDGTCRTSTSFLSHGTSKSSMFSDFDCKPSIFGYHLRKPPHEVSRVYIQKTTKNNEQWNVINIKKLVNSESCFVNNEHQNMSLKTQNNELLDSFTHPKPSSSTPSRSCSQKSTYWLYMFWPLHRSFCCSCFRLVEIPVMLKSISSKGCHPLQIAQNEDPREQSPARTNRTKTDWTSGTDEHVIVSLGDSIVAGWKTHHI